MGDFPLETTKDERCPAEAPYLCGTKTPGRGLCVATPEECEIRTIERRPIPSNKANSSLGNRYGYTAENLGRGCYLPFSSLKLDYEQKNSVHQLVPADFSLLTYNIWGLDKNEDLKRLFRLRKPLLIETLRTAEADMMCLQEMSQTSYGELSTYLDTWHYVSERPYTATERNRNRSVDTFFVSKYTPKRVANYALPGVLNYFNSMLVVEYSNLVIFNLYIQAGSKSSAGQASKWIHYSRCRADLLHIVYEMIQSLYRDQNVVICGDFNFHLDGVKADWPEMDSLEALQRIRFEDTYRTLYPKDPGYTEDTTKNLMRWNHKLMEKQYRYDAILYKGVSWKPVSSTLIGLGTHYLSAEDSTWFLDVISDARKQRREGDLRGIHDGCIPIQASDHFGVVTRFRKQTGGTRRRRQPSRRRTLKN